MNLLLCLQNNELCTYLAVCFCTVSLWFMSKRYCCPDLLIGVPVLLCHGTINVLDFLFINVFGSYHKYFGNALAFTEFFKINANYPYTNKTWQQDTTPPVRSPKFTFQAPYQVIEWKTFYIQAVDFQEALNINTEVEDNTKKAANS